MQEKENLITKIKELYDLESSINMELTNADK